MKVTVLPIVIAALGVTPPGLVKGLEGLEIRGKAYTIETTVLLRSIRILRRIDLRRLAVPQTPMKDHQLTLV